MRRSGFTMIELVFVIVILGILASVAIPKLAATRDDANIAKAATEMTALVTDIGAYYTAQGHFAKLSDMTNVQVSTDGTKANFTAGVAVDLGQNQTAFYIDAERDKKCIKITSDDATGKLIVTEDGDAVNSVFCKGLNKAIASVIKTHVFGGSTIYK